MIFYDNTPLTDANKTTQICGHTFFYNDLIRNVLKYVSGTNCICIAATFNTDEKGNQFNNFTHIGYYEDISDFLNSDENNWGGIHCFYFKNVKSKDEADEIVKLIKEKNPTHLFNE